MTEQRSTAQLVAASPAAAAALTDERLMELFATVESPRDAALLRMDAEGQSVDTVEVIGARHNWQAFLRIARAVERLASPVAPVGAPTRQHSVHLAGGDAEHDFRGGSALSDAKDAARWRVLLNNFGNERDTSTPGKAHAIRIDLNPYGCEVLRADGSLDFAATLNAIMDDELRIQGVASPAAPAPPLNDVQIEMLAAEHLRAITSVDIIGRPCAWVIGAQEFARALLSAQGCELATDATKQLGEHSVHEAMSTSSVPTAAPLLSSRETDRSELPRWPADWADRLADLFGAIPEARREAWLAQVSPSDVAASAAGSWISANDRMPCPNVDVLVFPAWGGGGVGTDQWWPSLGFWCGGVEDGWRPTHWMPLPAPPTVAQPATDSSLNGSPSRSGARPSDPDLNPVSVSASASPATKEQQ